LLSKSEDTKIKGKYGNGTPMTVFFSIKQRNRVLFSKIKSIKTVYVEWNKPIEDEISIRAMLIPTENDILWIFHVTNKLKN